MTISIGIVKWFGGLNRQKNKENEFGFIEDIAGFDVYLHLKDWHEDKPANESDVVVYSREEKNGKWKANDAHLMATTVPSLGQLLEWYELCESNYAFSQKYLTAIGNIKDEKFTGYTKEKLASNLQKFGVSKLVKILSEMSERWDSHLQLLVDLKLIDPLLDIAWDKLPEKYSVINNEKYVAEQLLSMRLEKSRGLVESNYSGLTPSLKMLANLAGLIADQELLEELVADVTPFVCSVYHKEEALPDYLKDYIDEHVKPKGGVLEDPELGDLFNLCQFKKYLYEKNPKFVSLYEHSDYLKSRFDVFVLKEIFSLVAAGNSLDQVYSLFLNQLWGGITSGQLNPVDQLDQILEVFPSCGSSRGDFSCEAVYWKKQDMYLCRGKPCHSPKVKGHAGTDYLTFSIYDWFVHYGINYFEDGEPSRRDFPIKVAGYINRVREIFDVIHCRSCQSLMLPNMTYARVDYTVYEKGQFVKKDRAPAYRLTVFKCPSDQCIESQNEYYINHCYGCNKIIDSRDCKTKCDAGLYICRSCASCCGAHSQTNPVGLCPDCTSPLQLFETSHPHRFRNANKRYVKCSKQSCSFNIPTDELDKRFYLDSCGPVEREQGEWVEWGFNN